MKRVKKTQDNKGGSGSGSSSRSISSRKKSNGKKPKKEVEDLQRSAIKSLVEAGGRILRYSKIGKKGKEGKAKCVDAEELQLERPETTFDDVIGHQGAKEELMIMCRALQSIDKLSALGSRMRRGAILYGPPGVGKTLLIKALAHESNCPFIFMSAASINKNKGRKETAEDFEDFSGEGMAGDQAQTIILVVVGVDG